MQTLISSDLLTGPQNHLFSQSSITSDVYIPKVEI